MKGLLSIVMVITLLFMVIGQRFLVVRRSITHPDSVKEEEEEELSLPIFKVKPLVIWSSDLHIGPIHDIKNFLKPMGVRVIDKNLDHYRCHITQTCGGMRTLKLINKDNSMHLDYSLIPKFYDAYVNDTEMASVDAFACFHAPALCELYAPFNKSLIILATDRYELGRFGPERWTRWNKNLIEYESKPWNFVAANNLYDVEYIKYFTGIQPMLLPSFCNFHNQTYNASKEKGFIFGQNTHVGFFEWALARYHEACRAVNCSVDIVRLRHKYRNNYQFSDIASHQGIVHVPYQVSVMSFFEQYRMNMPMFVASKTLLIEWEFKYTAMRDRTWAGAYGPRPSSSAIQSHPSQRSIPDPNSYTEHSVRYWLNFCDYYQFPYITYYDSLPHLIQILQTITPQQLMNISEHMRLFNNREEKRLRLKWKGILLKIANHSSNHPY